MASLSSVSDSDLLARMSGLVLAERAAVAEVIEHLMEIDRRKLYLDQACSSLYSYAIERLGYSEDAAMKRVRVARVAQKLPIVLEELRRGAIHLTGLFLLSGYLTEQNAEALLAEIRGQSRRELEKLLARWFPRPDAGSRIEPAMELSLLGPGLGSCPATGPRAVDTCPEPGSSSRAGDTCPEPGNLLSSVHARGKLTPLSAASYRVEFTASAELYAKLERAAELVSHTVPGGEFATLIERALDTLIENEMRRRTGAGKPRQRRAPKPGSRHVPREVARSVWERDGGQCTFVDAEARRCSERRYLTLEHRHPYALGGMATTDNICLLCASHNAHNARQVFGEKFLEKKRSERAISTKPEPALSPEATLRTVPTHSPESALALATERRKSLPASTFIKSDISTDPMTSASLTITKNPLNSRSRLPRGPSVQSDVYAQLVPILCELGFRKRQVSIAIAELCTRHVEPELEPLLREALTLLVPAPLHAMD